MRDAKLYVDGREIGEVTSVTLPTLPVIDDVALDRIEIELAFNPTKGVGWTDRCLTDDLVRKRDLAWDNFAEAALIAPWLKAIFAAFIERPGPVKHSRRSRRRWRGKRKERARRTRWVVGEKPWMMVGRP